MARLTREEQKLREMASEYVIEAILGRERMHKLVSEQFDLFVKLTQVFYNSGMSGKELSQLVREIEKAV